MAQKISASSFRLGGTQLWKFESNPNFYSNSSSSYLFIYFFLKQELKKSNCFIVDTKKAELKNKSKLSIILFSPINPKLRKKGFRKTKIKFSKTHIRKGNKSKLKKKKKLNKKNTKLFTKITAGSAHLKNLAQRLAYFKNPKIGPANKMYAYGLGICTTSSNFRLKQKPLKQKMHFNNYAGIKNNRRILIKRRSAVAKFQKNIKLKKLACLLECRVKSVFGLTYTILLKDVRSILSSRSNRQLAKIKKKLYKNTRRVPYFDEILDVVAISFDFKSSSFMAEYIAHKVSTEKKINPLIKALTLAIKNTFDLKKNIFALKLEVWGKRFKSGRTKKTKLVCGSLKLSTASFPAYESLTHAFTRFGTFGIRVILIKNNA